MNKYDNNGGSTGKPNTSMRRLLTDGTPPVSPSEPPPPPPRPFRERLGGPNLNQYVIPGILVLVLLIGVAIMAYSFGVNRGKSSANAERDRFIEVRQQSWAATATAASTNPVASPAPGQTDAAIKPGGYTLGTAIFARVDKIEGDKITLLLLDENGKPSPNSLVVNRTKQTQVWRTVPNQPVELRPGDSVLLVAERTNDSFDARSIQVLPTNS